MSFRYVYVSIFVFIILTLIACAISASRHYKDLGHAVMMLDIAFIFPALGNVLIVVATRKWLALIGFYIYFISMDFVVYELMRFTESYCSGVGRKSPSAPKWFKWVLLANAMQLLANPFTKHAFDVEWTVYRNELFYVFKPLIGLTIHLIADFGIYIAVVTFFAITTFRASHIYRERYIFMLISMIATGIWEAYIIVSRTPLNSSIIGIGLFGVIAYYFSIHYRPLKLLDKILSSIVSNGNEPCFIFSPRGRCVWVNKAAEMLVGVQEETCEKAPEALEYLFNTKLRRGNWSEQHSTGAGDSIKYYLFENHDVFNEKGKITGYYLKIKDITQEQLKIRKELYEATHDRLTGFYTKDHLFKIVKQAIEVHKDTWYLILYINIKSFKVVNDIFGNDFGDYAIKCFAERMKAYFSKKSIIGRIGGANFGVLIPKDEFDEKSMEDAISLINIKLGSAKYPIQSQIGAYEVDREQGDVSMMFSDARIALSTIESDDSARIAYYDDKLRKEILWNQEITAQLADAIKSRDIRPYLQPIADNSGKIVGCEALVRWIHKDHGFLAPFKFIPAFEKNGLIAEVDKYMWRCACEILSGWKKRGWDMFVSVNISPKDFYYLDVPKYIRDLVNEYGLDPRQLRVEITETVMINDSNKIISLMEEFRDYGFIVEMDDFGSGYSSLNMIKSLPVDVLKIDMNFLSKSDNEKKADTIVKNVIHLSLDLGMTSLTEGVETRDQYDNLTDMGCKLFQGYFFSKPIPAEEFEELVIVNRS